MMRYLRSIGKRRAHEMTALEIHDEIFDATGESIAQSTIHTTRAKFTGVSKRGGNPNSPFNRSLFKRRA